MKQSPVSTSDIEQDVLDESYLENATVHNLSWRKVGVERRSWKSWESDLKPKPILSNIDGYAEAGMKTSAR